MTPFIPSDIFQKSRVLIVDDNEVNRMILREMCLAAGFLLVEEAVNGDDGMKKALQSRPDLLLLDILMPNVNGLEMCQQLKQEDGYDPVIIIQSALDQPQMKAAAFQAGITDYIVKPVDAHELIIRTTAHLERRMLKRRMQADYERVQHEVQEAALLQSILFPDQNFLQKIRMEMKLDIASYYLSSSELGGDYISVKRLPSGHVRLALADMSGHGVSSALYTFVLHTLLEDQQLNDMEPSHLLHRLNERFFSLLSNGKFGTLFLGVVDIGRHLLHYSAAGSPQPVLLSSNKTTMLHTRGDLLGINHAPTYKTQTAPFNPGDILFAHSDALIETRAPNGQYLSEAELISWLKENQHHSADEILNNIMTRFSEQYSSSPEDDLSLLICKR